MNEEEIIRDLKSDVEIYKADNTLKLALMINEVFKMGKNLASWQDMVETLQKQNQQISQRLSEVETEYEFQQRMIDTLVSKVKKMEKRFNVEPKKKKIKGHIDELGLSRKVCDILKEKGIFSIYLLRRKTANDLLKIPNIGKQTLKEIQVLLAALGFKLKDDGNE